MKKEDKIDYKSLKGEIEKLENSSDLKNALTGNCQITYSYNLSKNKNCDKFVRNYGISMFSNNENALNFIEENKKEVRAKTKNCILIKS